MDWVSLLGVYLYSTIGIPNAQSMSPFGFFSSRPGNWLSNLLTIAIIVSVAGSLVYFKVIKRFRKR